MAKYAHKTLGERGYDSSEIYFLSHQPDLGINIVDRPGDWT
ncbi:hypothetical protein BGP_6612 [Beggiatoa sp. PS]|nr:hypothetical protein BGP_6612 [Beggiatoa sp. PS]